MNSHFLHQPERASGPRPLPEPGLGIAVINEREGLGDGFYKSPLLRALKRAYPAEKITWVVSEGDSPYRLTMAEIVRPYLARVLVDANLRRPTPGAIRRLRQLPPSSLVIDQRTSSVAVMAAKQMLRTKLYQAASRGYLFCSRQLQGPRPMHKLTQLMALLEAVTECPVDGSGDIDLPIDAEEHAAVLLPDGPRYVGLAPAPPPASAAGRWTSSSGSRNGPKPAAGIPCCCSDRMSKIYASRCGARCRGPPSRQAAMRGSWRRSICRSPSAGG